MRSQEVGPSIKSLPQLLARGLHRAYKLLCSPLLGNRCRFEPHCSDYALEAVEKHGCVRGAVLATWRVLRCNPYCRGGIDPVPAAREKR